jgi:uncharacterized integral membrane protein
MRPVSLILALLFLLAGIAFGAFNSADVALDFYWCQLTLPLGVALLGACLIGALAAGLLLWLTVIWPQRRRLRALLRSAGDGQAATMTHAPVAMTNTPDAHE